MTNGGRPEYTKRGLSGRHFGNVPPRYAYIRDRRTGKVHRVHEDDFIQFAGRGRVFFPSQGETRWSHSNRAVAEPFEGGVQEHGIDPFPEGEVRVPEPEWDQNPGGPASEFTKQNDRSEIRWGDMRQLNFPGGGLSGPPQETGYLITQEMWIPAMVVLRLASVEVTGALTTPGPDDTVLWSVQLGIGAALQTKQYLQQVDPLNGTANNDITLTLPSQVIRVSAIVTVTANVDLHSIQAVAMAAPFSHFPGMAK